MRIKQSILVSKKIAKSREEAKRIARKYADRIYTIRETENYYRIRQRPPEDFKGGYRTQKVANGIYIVWGNFKKII